MIARVASSCFWMTRYFERLDAWARRLYERERGALELCMMFHGISHSTMLHDEAFHFMKLGRAACAAMEPFSKKAPGLVDGASVARFLLFDASFPRSVLHNVERTCERIALLRRDDPRKERRGASGRAAGLRQTLLELADGGLERARLHDVLTWLVEENARLCDAIHADFLESREGSLRAQVQRLAPNGAQVQSQSARPIA